MGTSRQCYIENESVCYKMLREQMLRMKTRLSAREDEDVMQNGSTGNGSGKGGSSRVKNAHTSTKGESRRTEKRRHFGGLQTL